MNPGSNINTSGINVYFVATSPSSGEFRVLLQRKGALGTWWAIESGELAFRTAYQSHNHCRDPRNGGYVEGQPNHLYWPTNQPGEYRIVLLEATAPQATGFTRFETWTN